MEKDPVHDDPSEEQDHFNSGFVAKGIFAILKTFFGWYGIYCFLKYVLGFHRQSGMVGLAQMLTEALLTTFCILLAAILPWWALWPEDVKHFLKNIKHQQ